MLENRERDDDRLKHPTHEEAGRGVGGLKVPALPDGVRLERYEDDGALAGTTRYRVDLEGGGTRDVEVVREGDSYTWRIAHDALGVDNSPTTHESEQSALVAAVRHIVDIEESADPGEDGIRWD